MSVIPAGTALTARPVCSHPSAVHPLAYRGRFSWTEINCLGNWFQDFRFSRHKCESMPVYPACAQTSILCRTAGCWWRRLESSRISRRDRNDSVASTATRFRNCACTSAVQGHFRLLNLRTLARLVPVPLRSVSQRYHQLPSLQPELESWSQRDDAAPAQQHVAHH